MEPVNIRAKARMSGVSFNHGLKAVVTEFFDPML
jgi:hypothetical protein